MQLKPITAIVVLSLVVTSLLVAGCMTKNIDQGPFNEASVTAVATTEATHSIATAKPTAATPTPIVIVVTVTPPPSSKIATMVQPSFNIGYMPGIFGGTQEPLYQHIGTGMHYYATASDGTHPCGPANYYIDRQAAGGEWIINSGTNGQCPGGVYGGAGELLLSPADASKLSLGWHTMEIDYLGNENYAPSQWIGQFYVAP
jgi:hypothetical protein